MEPHRTYSVWGEIPMDFKVESAGIDMTCPLNYQACYSLAPLPGTGEISDTLTEELIAQELNSSLALAYFAVYPCGMTGVPEETPAQDVEEIAREDLMKTLRAYNAYPEELTLASQWLDDNNAALFEEAEAQDAFPARNSAGDAFYGAQRETPAAVRWVCACGQKNEADFCPTCGRKKSSYKKWICSCGAENEAPFCPRCGRRFN